MATRETPATRAARAAAVGFTVHEYPALGHATVFVSAGRRGLEIELDPADLVALTRAEVRPLQR